MIRPSTTRGPTSTAAYATINGAIWVIYVALVLLVTQVLAFADPLMITASVLITALALRIPRGHAALRPPLAARPGASPRRPGKSRK